MPSAIRVLVLEDQLPTRVGLRLALQHPGLELVAEVARVDEVVESAFRARPHVCLIDGDLNGDAIAAVRELKHIVPKTKVVFLSSSTPDDPHAGVLAAFDAGASGWLGKNVSPERLPALFRAVLNGEAVVPRSVVGRIMDAAIEGRRRARGTAPPEHASSPAPLNGKAVSRRDTEVLELLALGLGTAAIAAELGISEVTVRRHLSNASRKLGVKGRAAAVSAVHERSIGMGHAAH